MSNDYDDFKICTSTLFDGDNWDISCKLGLWGVACDTLEEAQDEALYYFRQYKSDGEYVDLLGSSDNRDEEY